MAAAGALAGLLNPKGLAKNGKDILNKCSGLFGKKGGKQADDVSPGTPVGRRGQRKPNILMRNAPSEINGRQYSGHALDRMQARGLVPSVVEDTIRHGRARIQEDGTIKYKSATNGVTVVVNAQGRVITAW